MNYFVLYHLTIFLSSYLLRVTTALKKKDWKWIFLVKRNMMKIMMKNVER